MAISFAAIGSPFSLRFDPWPLTVSDTLLRGHSFYDHVYDRSPFGPPDLYIACAANSLLDGLIDNEYIEHGFTTVWYFN